MTAKLSRGLRARRVERQSEAVRHFYLEVGWRVRAAREALGMTQGDLAKTSGISRTGLVNLEAGRQRSPTIVLARIAGTLGCSVARLIPVVGAKKGPSR